MFDLTHYVFKTLVAGISMSEILQYRKQFYESSYDIRVVCARGDSIEEIANKTVKRLQELRHDKRFTSTRREYSELNDASSGFLDVVLEGLAPDGGLYVPTKIPHLTQGDKYIQVSLVSYYTLQQLSYFIKLWGKKNRRYDNSHSAIRL